MLSFRPDESPDARDLPADRLAAMESALNAKTIIGNNFRPLSHRPLSVGGREKSPRLK